MSFLTERICRIQAESLFKCQVVTSQLHNNGTCQLHLIIKSGPVLVGRGATWQEALDNAKEYAKAVYELHANQKVEPPTP